MFVDIALTKMTHILPINPVPFILVPDTLLPVCRVPGHAAHPMSGLPRLPQAPHLVTSHHPELQRLAPGHAVGRSQHTPARDDARPAVRPPAPRLLLVNR